MSMIHEAALDVTLLSKTLAFFQECKTSI